MPLLAHIPSPAVSEAVLAPRQQILQWQPARLLPSRLFVARRCHYLLLIPQTDRQWCPLYLPPPYSWEALQTHKVHAQNLHPAFEAKPVSQGLHVDQVIRLFLLDRSSLKECKEGNAVFSDFERSQEPCYLIPTWSLQFLNLVQI